MQAGPGNQDLGVVVSSVIAKPKKRENPHKRKNTYDDAMMQNE